MLVLDGEMRGVRERGKGEKGRGHMHAHNETKDTRRQAYELTKATMLESVVPTQTFSPAVAN